MLISFYIEIPDCSRNYFWIVVSFFVFNQKMIYYKSW